MATLLHLSSIRDHRPFIINAEHVVLVRPQPYLEDNDEWATGAALMTIYNTQFIVAESCESVTQQWEQILMATMHNLPKDVEQEEVHLPEFTGELSYRAPSDEHYDWIMTCKSSANYIVCKTEREADALMTLLKRRPQCGVISMTRDFDRDRWVVQQWIQWAIMQDCKSMLKG